MFLFFPSVNPDVVYKVLLNLAITIPVVAAAKDNHLEMFWEIPVINILTKTP